MGSSSRRLPGRVLLGAADVPLLHGLPVLVLLLRLHHLPGRDAVAPPELPGDAPVADVVEPVEPAAGAEGRRIHFCRGQSA